MSRRARADQAPPITLFSFQDIMAAVTGVMILVTLLLAIEPLAEEMLPQTQPTASESPAVADRDASAEPTVEPLAEEEPPMAVAMAQRLVDELEAMIAQRRAEPEVDPATVASLEAQLAAMSAIEKDAQERLRRVEVSLAKAAVEREAAHRAESDATASLELSLERLDRESRRARVRFLPGERYEKMPLFIEVRADGCTIGAFDARGAVAPIADGRGKGVDPATVEQLLGPRSPSAHQLVLIVRQDALASFLALREALLGRGWEVGWQLWDANEGGFFDPPPSGEGP